MKEVVLGILVIAGVYFIIDYGFSIPDVHVSHTTNECVKVVNYTDEQFTCKNLPTRYNHIWVK